jgi:DNA repair ATPase RecN
VDDAKDVDGRPEQASTLSKNQRTRLEARIKELESLIPELEDDAAKLTLEMSTPEMAADFERLSSLTNSHRELTEKIQSLYAEWEKAAEALE